MKYFFFIKTTLVHFEVPSPKYLASDLAVIFQTLPAWSHRCRSSCVLQVVRQGMRDWFNFAWAGLGLQIVCLRKSRCIILYVRDVFQQISSLEWLPVSCAIGQDLILVGIILRYPRGAGHPPSASKYAALTSSFETLAVWQSTGVFLISLSQHGAEITKGTTTAWDLSSFSTTLCQ